MDVSIGDEIKDGFKKTESWVKSNLAFVQEMESFYKQRSLIEREYAEKLTKLAQESLQKTTKLGPTLSVGDEPTITPGSLECASVVAWKEVLIQCENIAREKMKLSGKFDSYVAQGLSKLAIKYSGIKDRWKQFDDDLKSTRDKHYNDMTVNKKAYDSACEAMESQRAKSLKSTNEKHQEKLTKREAEMNIAKNAYLISISVCNGLKDKYYYQDTPEILDGLQELNEAKVSKVNSILLSSSELEKKSNERINTFIDSIDSVVKQNLPKLDTAMFVKHNISNWSEPAHFQYIPSSIWHDDDQMIVNDSALYDLKLRLNNACATYEKLSEICNDEKQVVEEVLVERNKLVGDTFNEVQVKTPEEYQKFEELLIKSISTLQKFTNDDTKRVMAEVEIQTIQSATGDIDMTITTPIHEKKKSKFGFLKLNKHQGNSAEEPEMEVQELSQDVNNIRITPSNTKSRLFNTLGKIVDAYNTPVGEPINFRSTTTSSLSKVAIAQYPYEAQGEDEISMNKGDQFDIVDEDDGSGWTFVKSSYDEGLVPTSYLKIEQVQSQQKKKIPPKVVPRKNTKTIKRMEILYDYQSQGDDELSLQTGDIVTIIQDDDGSGWTEGEINGETGLFPTSYGTLV